MTANSTLEPTGQTDANAAFAASLLPAGAAKRKKPPKSFDLLRPDQITVDEVSTALMESRKRPDCAKLVPTSALFAAYFVPVSFAARDWGITPRRIRALLTAGRLAGHVLENGYWEVRYPYLFSTGTRGPGLKRRLG